VFVIWQQEGFCDPSIPGKLTFSSDDGLTMTFLLQYKEGLYYCTSDVYTVDSVPVRATCFRTSTHHTSAPHANPGRFTPTTPARQIESEVWSLRLGSPGKHQLDVLPRHVVGTPPRFDYHPFRFIDFKEQAYIRKQPTRRTASRLPIRCGARQCGTKTCLLLPLMSFLTSFFLSGFVFVTHATFLVDATDFSN
jgi:hypothetical protein